MGRGKAYAEFWCGNLREKPFGRPRRRWENNINMGIQEVGCGGMDCSK
jgi:hypothetical protein